MEADLPSLFYDQIPGWVFVAGTIVLFIAASEIGLRLAHRRKRARDEEKSHAAVLLAALLALLGLLLAFSFGIVEGRFLTRKQLVVREANAIGTTYLRAEMLPNPHRDRVENLLRQYVEIRSGRTLDAQRLPEAVRRSGVLHEALWVEAKQVAAQQPESEIIALFVQSLNDVIDLHEERVAVGVYHRLPTAILATLYAVALLTMGVLGYSAGLAYLRSPLPTAAVVTAIAIVISLIVELDRPWQRLFTVSEQSLADVLETMSKDY